MEEIQSIIEKVRFDIQEGRTEKEILQSLVPIIEKEPETAGRIIEALSNFPSLQMARLLQSMLENPCDKKVRKVIKRSLYRIKSRGITIEEISRDRERAIFRPLQVEPAQGYSGPYDFLGERFLMLLLPHVGRGFTVMQGIVSDTKGLVDFSEWEMSRKRFKPFFDQIQKNSPFPLVAMEPSYVGFLFVQASQLALAHGKTPLQAYLQAKKVVESIKRDYEVPLVYTSMSTEEIEGNDRLLRRGWDLLKMDLFGDWNIEEREIRPYADQVWEAEESKLILNQAQKESRFQEIFQKALSDLFPLERRALYQRRMEEMAYYLFKSGREEEAKISLAVAMDLKGSPNLIQPNPFLFRLVVKSIFALLSEAYEKKKEEFSLIRRP